MKKILLLFCLTIGIAVFASAQSSFSGTTANPTVSGENAVLNATVDTLNLTLSGAYNSLIKVQVRLSKTSGTIAGTVRLYGSIYGTTSTWEPVGDTLTLANQSINAHTWNLTGNDTGWKYLRILQSGGTTMAGTLSAKALGLKP